MRVMAWLMRPRDVPPKGRLEWPPGLRTVSSRSGVALFHQLHRGDVRPGCTVGIAAFDGAAALVQDKFQLYASALQGLSNGFGAQIQRLFIVAEGQVHRAAQALTVGEEIFRRLQTAEDLIFDIQRAPSPNVALGNGTGEGWIGPVVLRALHHRHHILMGHEQTRPQAWVAARAA